VNTSPISPFYSRLDESIIEHAKEIVKTFGVHKTTIYRAPVRDKEKQMQEEYV